MTIPKHPSQILRWKSVVLPHPQPGQPTHWSAATQQIQAPVDYEFRISEPSPGRLTVEILHRGKLSFLMEGQLLDAAETKEVCEFIAQTLSRRQHNFNGSNGYNGHNGHNETGAVGEALSPIGFG